MDTSVSERLWDRHANPKSGWSRTLLGPLYLLALYRRDWRLLAAALLATVLTPIAFGPPDDETRSWMTRAVRAEQWWLDRGYGTFGVSWPNVLNTVNVPTFAYSLYAASTRQPRRASTALALSMALKFGWIEMIAREYDASEGETL